MSEYTTKKFAKIINKDLGKTKTEYHGFIPAHRKIQQMIDAGERLTDYRTQNSPYSQQSLLNKRYADDEMEIHDAIEDHLSNTENRIRDLKIKSARKKRLDEAEKNAAEKAAAASSQSELQPEQPIQPLIV